jgi:GNAT superfamily N-acetyltransferase
VPESDPTVIIRRASEADLCALGKLGASLLLLHHAFDPHRFMAPPVDPEAGYAWFLGTQLKEADAAVFVAERGGAVIAYVYAALEPQSWKELRDEAGFIHDVVVAEEAWRLGIARTLIDKACEWLRSIGAHRVVIWTAEKNDGAQQLFTRSGFRRTMIEMTRELDS